MKKLIVFMIMIVSLFMTACDNEEKAKETTSNKQTTSEQYVQELHTAPCPQFTLNGIRHNGAVHSLVYDGALRVFDYSLLDGYVFMGIIYDDSNGTNNTPNFEFQSNYYDGASVLYNAQKNSYILWIQNDRAWLEIYEHTCNEDCIKTAD